MAYKDKERAREYNRLYRLKHLDEIKSYSIKYKESHKKDRIEYDREYYHKNREKLLIQDKKYRIDNRDKILSRHKKYNHDNKDRLNAMCRNYQKLNKEKLKLQKKIYNTNNPDIKKKSNRKRRALKINARVESYDDLYIYDRDNWICGLCGKKIDKNLKYPNPLSKSIDHIIPLSLGGEESAKNVQASHFGCNASKQNKLIGQLRLFG
jgi:5-methylcytosine-specific restriction endonuclease McrA